MDKKVLSFRHLMFMASALCQVLAYILFVVHMPTHGEPAWMDWAAFSVLLSWLLFIWALPTEKKNDD